MTFLPKLSDDYKPLRVSFDNPDLGTEAEKKIITRSIKRWNWADPERANYLPPLMELVTPDADPEVLVHWVDEVDDILKALGQRVILKDNAFGCCVTDRLVPGRCEVYLDRNMHKQLGPGWKVPVTIHELGHAAGLRHADATFPSGIMQASVVDLDGDSFRIVTQLERERMRELRVAGIVGVDSLEGN